MTSYYVVDEFADGSIIRTPCRTSDEALELARMARHWPEIVRSTFVEKIEKNLSQGLRFLSFSPINRTAH